MGKAVNTLVKYAAKGASGNLVKYVAAPRVQAALRAGNFIYQNRKQIYHATRGIKQRYSRGKPRVSDRVIGASRKSQGEAVQNTTPQVWTDVFIDGLYGLATVTPGTSVSAGGSGGVYDQWQF